MKKIMILTGLFAAGLIAACEKGGEPEQEEPQQQEYEIPRTKVEEELEKQEASATQPKKHNFSENELFFGKEGGEQTVTCPEMWDYWWFPDNMRTPPVVVAPPPQYDEDGNLMIGMLPPYESMINLADLEYIEGVQRVEVAEFTATGFRVIAPPGCSVREVVGSPPGYVGLPTVQVDPNNPFYREEYEEYLKSTDFAAVLRQFIRQFKRITYFGPEVETRTVVRDVDGVGLGFGMWWLYDSFETLVDGGWFTASRDFTDWYTSYEGFGFYKPLGTKHTTAGGVSYYSPHDTHTSIGVIGKWWIEKKLLEPGDYPVTIRVAPNDTGQPRRFILKTTAIDTPIIINQE